MYVAMFLNLAHRVIFKNESTDSNTTLRSFVSAFVAHMIFCFFIVYIYQHIGGYLRSLWKFGGQPIGTNKNLDFRETQVQVHELKCPPNHSCLFFIVYKQIGLKYNVFQYDCAPVQLVQLTLLRFKTHC